MTHNRFNYTFTVLNCTTLQIIDHMYRGTYLYIFTSKVQKEIDIYEFVKTKVKHIFISFLVY